MIRKVFMGFIVCCMLSCTQAEQQQTKESIKEPTESFKQTWYSGKAEISSYTLQQARYGEMRQGEAVLIFVTEDFDRDKLVKADDPNINNNVTRVLKLNMTKNFITGIYPYSMMLSVFKPVSAEGKEQALKANCSSQEWCGHTFSQLQLKGDHYQWQLNSYFEKENEQDKQVEPALLEDELWNHIRINPATLPLGKVKLIPSLLWQRLTHNPVDAIEAELTLSAADTSMIKGTDLQRYTIHYPTVQRTLKIFFERAFPHQVKGWTETYPDGFGDKRKVLTTSAVLKQTIWLPYWKHNKNVDVLYRDSLQLKRYEQ